MLDLLGRAELEAAQVGVHPHLLSVDLLGVVVDLGELGHAALGPGEDVAPAASQPAVLVEAQECGVHPDTAPSLVDSEHKTLQIWRLEETNTGA